MAKKMGTAGAITACLALACSFVGNHEGISLVAYLDPVGIPTICYGHTAGVTVGQTKSQDECDALLAAELGQALAAVDQAVNVPMPDSRRAALASFTYNAGKGAFLKSTLLRKMNAGDVVGACNELRRWVYAGGKKRGGLVRRREAERALCLKGTEQAKEGI